MIRTITPTPNSKVEPICKACGICESQHKAPGTMCAGLNKDMNVKYEFPETFPKTYSGLRFTADAMDCSLPISIDSFSGCSFNCIYCFSNNLQRAPDRNAAMLQKVIKEGTFYSEWNITKLERFLARELKDKQGRAMYPLLDAGCPVQLGALGDPFNDLELHSGWAKKAIPLFIKYKVPVRIGTKGGTVLQRPEYLKLFESSPDQFWFAFSIITNSDELISKIDINAPNTTERLKAMKALTDIGCHASIRFRPFLPGVSDSYPGEPEAWRTLIDRSKASGARAISFEYIFLNAVPTPRQKEMDRLLFKVMGNPKFGEQWNAASNMAETCRRGNRDIKFAQTIKVRDHVRSLGMTFGISDPHFKELNDTGSCCFINPYTLIYTIEGLKHIVNIQKGDLVLTHKGRFRKVKDVFIRHKQEAKLVTLHFPLSAGSANAGDIRADFKKLTVTEEHPILLSTGEWIPANKIKKGDSIKFLSTHCTQCGKPIPFYKEFCSQSCQSTWVAINQWKREDHIQNMSLKAITQHQKQHKIYGDLYPWSEKLAIAVSKANKQLIKEGKHIFQKPGMQELAFKALGKSNKGSYIERILFEELKKRNIEVEPQYPILIGKGLRNITHYYFIDFAIPDLKIAIECDGEQWHNSNTIEKDNKRQTYIEKLGWQFLRFTGNELKHSLSSCADQVQRLIKNHNGEYEFFDVEVINIEFSDTKTNKRKVSLYNFSVEEDESYIAKGFVVHNCGMPESGDKWFSNWSRRQMTEVIVQAKRAHDRGEARLFNYEDWRPEWAHQTRLNDMISLGNWHNLRIKKHTTFGDHMRVKWNNPKHPRGPFKYFGGVLFPIGVDAETNDLVYKYREWQPGDSAMNLWEYNSIEAEVIK
jgi:DNA repair photolyase/predicted nucleic acid-binding Zn ribbon protein